MSLFLCLSRIHPTVDVQNSARCGADCGVGVFVPVSDVNGARARRERAHVLQTRDCVVAALIYETETAGGAATDRVTGDERQCVIFEGQN